MEDDEVDEAPPIVCAIAKPLADSRLTKKVLKVVGAECAKFRPDLKDAAVRRAASIQKSLRAKKGKKSAAGALTVV